MASPQIIRVKEIFAEALERSGDERSAYLDQACGDDAGLRAEVEAYLAASEKSEAMLGNTSAAATPHVPLSEGPGTSIGRYKLLQQIGEGGFGVVFMAEQQQPVRRRVALKIIKLGMDTRQVVARFEAERQALAMMDHPSVAKVFDGGATETGRPYFVMELVAGTPITEYCDKNNLNIHDRLELFGQVCQAVQHAHQKGLIHRDLKPNNVLVATQDDRPVAKVIDFGIAKATAAQLTEKTVFTEFRQFIGTPEYMSPEQADGSLDIDTRSDVYSLGVLLYEMLAGSTPFDPKELRSKAYAEIQRIIREVDPPRPSTRLSTLETLASVAASRRIEPRRLADAIRGELDWIVMKAMEKDRSRRYETANALCRDVERYLADEPVSACPPSAAYRFRKFARRNKSALLVASAMLVMLLLLVAGLTVSNVVVARERNQKAAALVAAKESAERAELERQRAQSSFVKARTAVTRIVVRAATGQGEWSSLSPALRKVFTDEAALYYQSMIQEHSADPSIRFETAVGYRALGGLHTNAKEFESAEKYYRRSIEMLEALLKESGKDADYRQQLAWSNSVMAAMLVATTRPAEARHAYERSVELYESLLAQAPFSIEYLDELARSHEALVPLGGSTTAADLQRTRERQLAALQKVPESSRKADEWIRIAWLQGQNGHNDEAARAYREVIRLAPDHQYARGNLAYALIGQGKPQEAERVRREWLARLQMVPESLRTLMDWNNIGWLHAQTNHLDEAARAYLEAIRLAPDDNVARSGVISFSDSLIRQGKAQEAERVRREWLTVLQKVPESSRSLTVWNDIGSLQAQTDHHDEAARAYLEAIRLAPNDKSARSGLISVLIRQGKPQEVERVRREWLAVLQNVPESSRTGDDWSIIGWLHVQSGRDDEAARAFGEAFRLATDQVLVKSLIDGVGREAKPALAERIFREWIERAPKSSAAHRGLAETLMKQHRVDEAAEEARKVVELGSNDGNSHNTIAWWLATEVPPALRKPRDAVELAKKAVELAPSVGAYWNTLGVAQYRAGAWQPAIEALEKSMSLRAGGDANDWFFVAMIQWQRGEKNEARQWYDRAVGWMSKNGPSDPELLSFRAEAAQLLGITDAYPASAPASAPATAPAATRP